MMDDYRNDPDYIDQQFDATPEWANARTREYNTRLAADGVARRDRRGSTTDTLDAFAHRARIAPLSLAMVAIGVAGLMMNRRPKHTYDDYDDYEDHDYRMPVGTGSDRHSSGRLDALKSRASHAAEELGERAEGLQEKAAGLVGEVSEKVSHATEDLRETAADYAEDAYRSTVAGYKVARNRAAHLARKAPERGAHLVDETGSWVRENPVPLALTALALGAVAATVVTYKRKDEWDMFDEDYPRDRTPYARVTGVGVAANTAAEAAATRSQVSPRKSPDVSAAIPAGKSKLGENVVESTSVLGVAENEKKS